MFKRLLIFGLFLSIALLVISPSALAQDDGATPPQGLRPDAPPYAVHGPYAVGTRDFVIEPDSERPLQVTVWYPALNPDGLEESIVYIFQPKIDLGMPDWRPGIIGHALADAEFDMTGAPYPLVIFSHGFGVNRQTYAYVTEHLASYGFVVIAPDHIEMFDSELSELWESSIERPKDTQQVIAFAESSANPGGDMEGLFTIEQIGVAGHSYGGYTALAAGGARFDLAGFNSRCDALAEDDAGQFICNLLVPREAEMAALAGYDAVPDGLWDSWGDPRVKGIIAMSGDSYLFDAAGLKEITIPVMAMVGSIDTGTAPEWGAYPTYEFASSSQKALVVFDNAEHYIFQWQCADVPDLVAVGFFPVCADQVWDMSRAHDLINHFTTAFLLAVLYGDTDAAAALAPDAVQFPGITYETTGY